MTLAPYMGLDSIDALRAVHARKAARACSSCAAPPTPARKDFEYETLADGRHVYDMVGDKLQRHGQGTTWARSGYSSLGLVIGGTHIEEAKADPRATTAIQLLPHPRLRRTGRHRARTSRSTSAQGNGGVVNSSRGVLLAYKKQPGTCRLPRRRTTSACK